MVAARRSMRKARAIKGGSIPQEDFLRGVALFSLHPSSKSKIRLIFPYAFGAFLWPASSQPGSPHARGRTDGLFEPLTA
jgi:hypothetical protein